MSNALTEIKASFFKLCQGRNMKLEKYHELFQAQAEVLDEVRITIENESWVNLIAQDNGRVIPNAND